MSTQDLDRLAAIEATLGEIRTALLGATDGSRVGLHARVTALENQWGRIYALMTVPVGALVAIAVNQLFGGKHP